MGKEAYMKFLKEYMNNLVKFHTWIFSEYPKVGNMFLTEFKTILSAAENNAANLDELLEKISKSKVALIEKNDPKPNEERINLFVEEAKLWADRVLSIAESDHLLAEKVWIPFYFGLSSTAEEASVADDVVADDVEKKTITQQMNAVELK